MRCIIVAAGPYFDPEQFRKYYEEGGFLICADAGYKHLEPLGIIPDLLVGDFDSLKERRDFPCPILKLSPKKDDTDSRTALKHAISKGYDEFYLFGMLGGRMDHGVENLSLLYYLSEQGKKGMIVDPFETIEVIDGERGVEGDKGDLYSFLNIGEEGIISLDGFLFPLENKVITSSFQLAISNELASNKGKIKVSQGKFLMCKVL